MQVLTHPQAGKSPSSPPPSSPGKRTTRSVIISLTIIALLLSVGAGTYVTTVLRQRSVTHAAPAITAVTTYKNDLSRTGQNLNEVILNTSNVNQNQFGKQVEYVVDGQVYAQPLYLPNVTIGGTLHNVVFVVTEHDSLYAFDADQISPTPLSTFLWHRSFINPPSVTTVSSSNVGCNDINPEYGITGTPVIDPSTNTLYVVVNTLENGTNIYRFHAIDLTTGNDKSGSPTLIQASVGTVTFDPVKQMNRPGLLLLNGVVYTGWGSHCDIGPYHGWLIGYDASTYQQVTVYNDTVNGNGASMWQSGQGIAADSSGNIYVMTGNGTFDVNTGGVDLGDSFIKLSTQGGLKEVDYFTPFNQSCLNVEDNDLGSGGPVLLPTSHEMVGVGKEGRVYVVSRDNLGQYTPDPSLNCTTSEENRTDLDKIVQELPPNTANGGVFGSPSYWKGPAAEFVYLVGVHDHVKAFQLSNGLLSTAATSQSPESFSYPGGDVALSSNGNSVGSGIAWTIGPNAVLYAYDATNLATELYNSSQNASRDGLPSYTKFSVPTIANGEVFVGTHGTLDIYGLLSTTSGPTLSSLSPNAGALGKSVRLIGANFGSAQGSSTVTFGSTPASVTSWSATSIVVAVPNTLTPGAVNVTVTVGGKTSNSQTFTVTATAYNNVGISDDGNPKAGNINGIGESYSAQALVQAPPHITPGNAVVVNGVTFTWPNVAAGSLDNYKAKGQTVPVTPVNGATTLAFLGCGNFGSASGTATITYSDGSTQTFTLGLTRWIVGTPAFGNTLVATMPYHNTAKGKLNTPTYLYYTDVTLQSGKTVSSVTLPSTISKGQLHVFAIATK